MAKLAIWAEVQAKPGKEKEVEGFLKSAQPLAEREGGTLTWYAVQIGPGKYGIFDTFADEKGRFAVTLGISAGSRRRGSGLALQTACPPPAVSTRHAQLPR